MYTNSEIKNALQKANDKLLETLTVQGLIGEEETYDDFKDFSLTIWDDIKNIEKDISKLKIHYDKLRNQDNKTMNELVVSIKESLEQEIKRTSSRLE